LEDKLDKLDNGWGQDEEEEEEEDQQHPFQEDHNDVTNFLDLLKECDTPPPPRILVILCLVNLRIITTEIRYPLWEINFCDLKFVGSFVFQLSIFIPREAHTYLISTPHPPDPPETVKVLPR
jgi:hypothetical protein